MQKGFFFEENSGVYQVGVLLCLERSCTNNKGGALIVFQDPIHLFMCDKNKQKECLYFTAICINTFTSNGFHKHNLVS